MLELVDVHTYYGDSYVLQGISLEVKEGSTVALLGRNGMGKTTTIRMLSGIISSAAGYAVVAGQRTDGEVGKLHEVIGLLTETPGFYNNLSARYNLEFYARFYNNITSNVTILSNYSP